MKGIGCHTPITMISFILQSPPVTCRMFAPVQRYPELQSVNTKGAVSVPFCQEKCCSSSTMGRKSAERLQRSLARRHTLLSSSVVGGIDAGPSTPPGPGTDVSGNGMRRMYRYMSSESRVKAGWAELLQPAAQFVPPRHTHTT